jgi:hypothetical protein
MKRLIVCGDSHTGVFFPFSDEILAIYSRGALTLDAFTRGQTPAYVDLVAFLKSLNRHDCSLVLCLSEVDLRAHFWRDMPMLEARGLGFDDFLLERVDAFLDRVQALSAEVNLPDVILWGAPASQRATHRHSEELPATGDSITRNALTHLFNSCLMRRIVQGGTALRFATPFYGMVDDDLQTDARWLRDGVHLRFELKPHCLELLQPLRDGNAVATFSRRHAQFEHARFELVCLEHQGRSLGDASPFRTWIQDGGDARLRLKNRFGSFALLPSPHHTDPDRSYAELALRRSA